MIGTQFNHYRLISQLGKGGMGEVYLAEDCRLDRKVAIKFIVEELQADRTSRLRFLREAKSAAALDHPFVCKVFEADETDGKAFIVMEYVEGQNLSDRLSAGPLPLNESLLIAGEIAEALTSAHERGFMHRDLKPSNIMLTREGHIKVMDFGLAKPIPGTGDAETQKVAVTQGDAMVGTYGYMSPEQIKGEPADGRTDIFAFGLVLYEMLSGVHPFQKSSPLYTSAAILHEASPPLRLHGANVPDNIEQVIQRCLAKDPADRYPSFRDVRAALVPSGQVGSSTTPLLETKPKRASKRLWQTAATLVFVLAMSALTSWIYLSYFRSPRAALAFSASDFILVTDLENLTGDPLFDRSLQTAITVGIQQSQYVYVFPQSRVAETLERMRKPNVEKLDESLASEVAVREGIKALFVSSISQVGSEYLLTARLVDPNSRIAVMTESVRVSNKDGILDGLDTLIKKVREGLGESLSSISAEHVALPKATTASLSALKTYADSIRLRYKDGSAAFKMMSEVVQLDPDFALAQAELGMMNFQFGNAAEGEKHFVKALSLVNRLTLREKLWVQALAEDWRGNRDEAIRTYDAYLSAYPDDQTAWFRLGWTSMITGNYEKAIASFNKALALKPSDSASYINLATTYGAQGKSDEALATYQKVFELAPKERFGTYVNHEYGFLLVRMGLVPRAIENFQEMITSPDGSKALGSRSLGLLNMYLGKESEAVRLISESALSNKAEGATLSEFRDRMYIAVAYQARGMRREFDAEMNRVAVLERQMNLSPEWLYLFGRLYARSGKPAEAQRLLQKMPSRLNQPVVVSGVNRSDRASHASFRGLQGEVAAANGKLAEAMESIEQAYSLENGPLNLESLAYGYMKQGKLDTAIEKYLAFLNHPIVFGQEAQEYWLNAHLQLGKIYEQKNEPQKAREWYEKLVRIWKDADPDVVALLEAKSRLSKLPQ